MTKEQVSSILRVLQILECFMDCGTEWTLKALVEQLGLPTTTVFRQVSTLTAQQYLIQDPVRKSYHIGPRFMLLASSILEQSSLRQIARPELERLSCAVQETINLSLLLEHDIFYLDKVETHRSIVCNTKVGSPGSGLRHQQRKDPPVGAKRGLHGRVLQLDAAKRKVLYMQHHHRSAAAAQRDGAGAAARLCRGRRRDRDGPDLHRRACI